MTATHNAAEAVICQRHGRTELALDISGPGQHPPLCHPDSARRRLARRFERSNAHRVVHIGLDVVHVSALLRGDKPGLLIDSPEMSKPTVRAPRSANTTVSVPRWHCRCTTSRPGQLAQIRPLKVGEPVRAAHAAFQTVERAVHMDRGTRIPVSGSPPSYVRRGQHRNRSPCHRARGASLFTNVGSKESDATPARQRKNRPPGMTKLA